MCVIFCVLQLVHHVQLRVMFGWSEEWTSSRVVLKFALMPMSIAQCVALQDGTTMMLEWFVDSLDLMVRDDL